MAQRDTKGRFVKGISGNPKGKAAGAREALVGDVVKALAEDFRKHGARAIAKLREEDTAAYVRVVASLVPKEMVLEHRSVLDDWTAEELAELRRAIADERAARTGAGGEGAGEPPAAGKVSALH